MYYAIQSNFETGNPTWRFWRNFRKDLAADLLANVIFPGDNDPLREGWRIQRDTPGYGPRRTAEELRKDLAAAKRYADQ